jgi:hypothetical protein
MVAISDSAILKTVLFGRIDAFFEPVRFQRFGAGVFIRQHDGGIRPVRTGHDPDFREIIRFI